MEKERLFPMFTYTHMLIQAHTCLHASTCVCAHTHGTLKVFPVTLSHAQPAFHFPTLKLMTITSCLVFIVVV